MSSRQSTCLPPGDVRPRTLREQFGNPTGPFGWLVGHVMAIKNRDRGRKVLAQLELETADAVLEVGFGPGVDLRRAAALAGSARLAGIDRSAEMLRQARARNARDVATNRMDLRLGSVDALPFADGSFDRVYTLNSVQFWAHRDRCLGELRRVLRPGGLLAVAIQPRNAGATPADAEAWRVRLEAELAAAGFVELRAMLLEASPVPVACLLGRRQAA